MNLKAITLTLALVFSLADDATMLGDTDGAWSMLGFNGYAGEVVINNLSGSSYFYWMFEAIKGNIFTDKLPLVL